jgi:hypothetical protein
VSATAKNRLGSVLEGLEGRVLADAKMPVVMPPAMGNVAVVQTAISHGHQLLAGPKAVVSPKSVNSGFQFTALTIVNNSNATVAYSIKWGNGNWTSYTLAPHYQRTHYIAGLNQSATISYDKSFAAGYQAQQYVLPGTNITFPAGFYLVDPTPSVGSGHHYTFANVSGGVQLYA